MNLGNISLTGTNKLLVSTSQLDNPTICINKPKKWRPANEHDMQVSSPSFPNVLGTSQLGKSWYAFGTSPLKYIYSSSSFRPVFFLSTDCQIAPCSVIFWIAEPISDLRRRARLGNRKSAKSLQGLNNDVLLCFEFQSDLFHGFTRSLTWFNSPTKPHTFFKVNMFTYFSHDF